jgi:hypothetical protein
VNRRLGRFLITGVLMAGLPLGFVAVSTSAGSASTAVAATTAHADTPATPDGMSASTYRLMLAQIPLDAAATKIRHAAAHLPATGGSLDQIAVDDAHHRLTVYWHGKVPPAIKQLLASLRRHVGIEVAAARYSAAQLDQAVAQAMHARSGVPVTGAGPLTDGSGIQVFVGGARPTISARTLLGVTVPVKFVTMTAPRPATCWSTSGSTVPGDTLSAPARCNDLSPGYWGGAVIINQTYGNGCSTGFGVHSTVDSKTYMLTDSHCGNTGDSFNNGQRNQTLGSIYLENHGHDDAAIQASVGNAYYDGSGIYQGDTHNAKLVSGEQPSSVGDRLCESGAYGGVICALQIPQNGLNLTLSYYDDDAGEYITVSNVAETTKGSGGYGNGLLTPGDSGGPVFSLASAGHVTAKGLNLAVNSTNNFFMTIDWVSSDFKVSVNTG